MYQKDMFSTKINYIQITYLFRKKNKQKQTQQQNKQNKNTRA